jgi:hypothetical protein
MAPMHYWERLMPRKDELKLNEYDSMTDADISAAISYLDSDSRGHKAILAMCMSGMILVVGCTAFILLYRRMSQ